MTKNLKLLIGGSSSKIFHLKEFSNSLEKIGVECKLVFDEDYADGFPSRNFGNWLKSDKKFENLIKELTLATNLGFEKKISNEHFFKFYLDSTISTQELMSFSGNFTYKFAF